MKRFRYTSLEELRRDYKVQNDVSDEILLNLVEISSNLINNITSQIFDVYRDTVNRVPDDKIFYSENLVPIIEIVKFEVNNSKSKKGGSVYGSSPYDWFSLFGSETSEEIDDRYYDLRDGHINLFFEPRTELSLDAYFGRIQTQNKVEYTVTQDISPRSSKIYLNTIEGLYKGKSLIINDTLNVIVNDARSNYILVDRTYNDEVISTDSKAYSFGYILPDIKRACALLVLDRLSANAIADGDTTPTSGSPLKREKTDNYEYEYQTAGNQSTSGLILGRTGNVEVDGILEDYMPPSVAMWV